MANRADTAQTIRVENHRWKLGLPSASYVVLESLGHTNSKRKTRHRESPNCMNRYTYIFPVGMFCLACLCVGVLVVNIELIRLNFDCMLSFL